MNGSEVPFSKKKKKGNQKGREKALKKGKRRERRKVASLESVFTAGGAGEKFGPRDIAYSLPPLGEFRGKEGRT